MRTAVLLVTISLALGVLRAQSTSNGVAPSASIDDWSTYNRTYTGERFSPLKEITSDNVARLRPVCTFDTGEQASFETGPLVIGGVMYVTTDTVTYALDAATCAQKWKHEHGHGETQLRVSRGAAYDSGRLFRGAGNGRVVAVDAAAGRTVWDVQLNPTIPGVTVPMAPVAWNGLVFVGNAGGDIFGVTGHVWALDQRDGRVAWRFDVVPESGAARDTWKNDPAFPITGGAFWTTFALDSQDGVLYVPAGNPAPDFLPEVRPGENLYSNSVVALDAKNGAVLGYIQVVKNDYHDWDVSAGPVILTTRGGRRVVASANKDGLLSSIDRSSVRRSSEGAAGGSAVAPKMTLLFQTPTTTRENVETPLSSDAPVRFCPGTQGGTEWNGPAYDSALNLLFVGATDWCTTVQVRRRDTLGGAPGAFWSGATQGFGVLDPPDTRQGWLTAIDADTGAVRWKYRSTLPMVAGVTPTAAGLVFTGEMNGDAIALEATTGKVVWRQPTGNAVGGGVVTYRAGGKQLVAMAAGFKSAVWRSVAESNRVIVFGLP